jgi:hypothetical protein
MLRRSIGAAVLLLLAALPCWAARGETSFRLPETVEAVAAGAGIVRSPLWEREADRVGGRHDMLAIGSGTVAFATGGRLCGYAEADGKRRWCVAGGTDPAYAAGEVAFSSDDGGSASVDAVDGRARWQHGRHGTNDEEVWSAGIDFLIRDVHDTISEVSPSGAILWSAKISNTGNPLVVRPFAIFPMVSDGAFLSMEQRVVRLGRDGGTGISFTSSEIAKVALPYAFITLAPFEEVEDHFFTVDVGRVDVRSGKVDQQFHFEPDYDVTSESYSKTGTIDGVSDTSQAALRFDGTNLYATVGHNVYRYVYAEPSAQHPLLVARDAQLLGGPFRGAIFVHRRGGVWSLRPERDAIRARLVAASAAAAVSFTLADDDGYVAFSDGSVRGFDAASGRPLLAAKPCDPALDARIGVGRNDVYVVCTLHARPHVFAFPRTPRDASAGPEAAARSFSPDGRRAAGRRIGRRA